MAKNSTAQKHETALAEQSATLPTTTVETNNSVPAVIADAEFEDVAGMGLENVTPQDLLIPRLTILQGLSPQMDKGASEYVQGAELGDICDVALGQLYKNGILFLPVFYRKDYLEWAPRNSGRGLIKIHNSDGILKDCRRGTGKDEFRYFHGENLVAETAQFFGFNLSAPNNSPSHCFIPMSSTSLKIGRKWINLATGERVRRQDGSSFPAPIFYRTYKITTASISNNQGKWSTWNIARDKKLSELDPATFGDYHAFIAQAKVFREAIISGAQRADLSQTREEGEQQQSDDKVPF